MSSTIRHLERKLRRKPGRKSGRKKTYRKKTTRSGPSRMRGLRFKLLSMEGFIIYIIAIFCIIIVAWVIYMNYFSQKITKLKIPVESVAAFRIPYKTLSDLKLLGDKYAIPFSQLVALYSVQNDFFPNKTSAPDATEIEQKFIMGYDNLRDAYKNSLLVPYDVLFQNLFEEIQYFPIASGHEQDGSSPYMYGDSWGDTRSYGGDREHLGTDILDRENVRGRIPIVSMTAGLVENIGWNEMGGYRVGIRSKNGTYYYYAHLESFASNLAKGINVSAGQLIGYMGDTGYGKKEGTTGEFPVHLHVGISPETKLTGSQFWINPYPFLRYIESSKVYCDWRNP